MTILINHVIFIPLIHVLCCVSVVEVFFLNDDDQYVEVELCP